MHGYEEYGDAILGRLEGMFGLAIWDRRRQRLLVARDPLGIKPLYYARLPDSGVVLASELNALLTSGAVSRVVCQPTNVPSLTMS